MPPSEAPGRLRIAVVGLSGEEVGWASQLAGHGVEVVVIRDVRDLRSADVQLGVLLTTPEGVGDLLPQLTAGPTPPLALFVERRDGVDRRHQVSLLKILVSGKREWERTFDAILDPIMVLDGTGRVMRANMQMARALGRSIQEIHGEPYSTLLGPAVAGTGDRFPGAPSDPIAESLGDGTARHVETRYERLPGMHEVTVSALGEERGEGLVVILKDVSERRDHQERMQRSGRLADIGQLAAGIAHEINTPLASIALRAESLMKAAEDPRLQAVDAFKNFPRYLKTIDEEIFRCKKIISALLDFSRARRPEVRDTDLNQLAEKAADLVGHQIKLKQVDLALALDPALPHVTADDGQLRQALLALLINALDATASGGKITLSTARAANGMVALTVGDTGAGIPPEHLDKIFTPFFTTKPVGQGTGLGLSACHGIVSAHGGEIQVDSALGGGTRMTMLLPAAARAASA
jgi:two-component system, NtrC family, sensor kinase